MLWLTNLVPAVEKSTDHSQWMIKQTKKWGEKNGKKNQTSETVQKD